MKLQFVEYKDGWAYRFTSKGRILLHSEAYDSKQNAERAAESFKAEFFEAINESALETEYIHNDGVIYA